MSIPSPTPTTTSDPSLPSLDPVSTSGGGGQSANYFFGFLITFAVLLVVFIVAGIFSRRRVQARRAAALAAGMGVFGSQSWEDGLRRGRPVWIEQRLEDPVLVREKEKDTSADVNNGVSEKWRWKNIKPLCAVLTLPEHEELKPEAHDEDEKF
ncbi:hypothetical protein DXG01_012648 [Tephrocybe rancida]|nr:hypothetical protein DXG01_012648 [Tephrocybe rancida]